MDSSASQNTGTSKKRSAPDEDEPKVTNEKTAATSTEAEDAKKARGEGCAHCESENAEHDDSHEATRASRELREEQNRPLKAWLEAHLENPYPSRSEKRALVTESGLTLTQVDQWFQNVRKKLRAHIQVARFPMSRGWMPFPYGGRAVGRSGYLPFSPQFGGQPGTWPAGQQHMGYPGAMMQGGFPFVQVLPYEAQMLLQQQQQQNGQQPNGQQEGQAQEGQPPPQNAQGQPQQPQPPQPQPQITNAAESAATAPSGPAVPRPAMAVAQPEPGVARPPATNLRPRPAGTTSEWHGKEKEGHPEQWSAWSG